MRRGCRRPDLLALVEAGPGDLDALAHFVNAAYRGAFAREGWSHEADLREGQRTDPSLLAEMIAPPSVVLVEHTADGVLRACVQLAPKGAQRLYFGMLAVAPTHQGGGLGRQMVEAIEARARAAGYTAVEMTVIHLRTTLIAWYERLGYRRTGAVELFPYGDVRYGRPMRDDLTLVVLEKRL